MTFSVNSVFSVVKNRIAVQENRATAGESLNADSFFQVIAEGACFALRWQDATPGFPFHSSPRDTSGACR